MSGHPKIATHPFFIPLNASVSQMPLPELILGWGRTDNRGISPPSLAQEPGLEFRPLPACLASVCVSSALKMGPIS